MDIVVQIRDFFGEHLSSIGGLGLLFAGGGILTLLAAREFVSWLARSDQIQNQLKNQGELLRKIAEQIEELESQTVPQINKEKPTQEKQNSFPLNH